MGITLARGGSKRVPQKNVIDVNGKPLIQYTIDEAKKSEYIDNYIVSTDDEDIKMVCRELEQTYFDRSTAEDTQKSSDGLLEVLRVMDKPDYIVEIMCTNPLKTVEDIDGVIKKLDIMGVDSVCSVVRVWDYHPSRVKFIEGNKMVDVYPEVLESRRQDLTPPAYIRNGSIYAMTWNHLRMNETRYDKNTVPYIMPEERTINIDEPIDLELARIMLK
ncbi:cytidylyltransferase [Candidatus Pacearchaeota archaeon]|jgi:CMP-N-acetylneuraminic acid synthetase|nr:cytidylyltransferase [Candidatus Pacearchaeota archaeon]